MSKKVTIGNTTYVLATQGTPPAWGEDLSAIIEALIAAVNNEQGPNDILESAANIANIGSFPAVVNGFYFDPINVRSFVAEYNISRKITKSIVSTSGDGSTVTINLASDHYLHLGDSINISGSIPGLAGNHVVTAILSDDSFQFSGTYVGNDNTSTFQIELIESGTLYGNHGLQGWRMAHTSVGDAQADLDINTLGNITYNPETLIGSGYTGTIRFTAKTIANS